MNMSIVRAVSCPRRASSSRPDLRGPHVASSIMQIHVHTSRFEPSPSMLHGRIVIVYRVLGTRVVLNHFASNLETESVTYLSGVVRAGEARRFAARRGRGLRLGGAARVARGPWKSENIDLSYRVENAKKITCTCPCTCRPNGTHVHAHVHVRCCCIHMCENRVSRYTTR